LRGPVSRQRAVSLFSPSLCRKYHSYFGEQRYDYRSNSFENKNWGIPMRVFLACAIIVTAAIGLGGCWGHHEKAVVAEPLKLG
jgi:hypothetical protein